MTAPKLPEGWEAVPEGWEPVTDVSLETPEAMTARADAPVGPPLRLDPEGRVWDEAGKQLGTRWSLGVHALPTPQGPQLVTGEGRPVASPEEAQALSDAAGQRQKLEALAFAATAGQSGGYGFADELAGLQGAQEAALAGRPVAEGYKGTRDYYRKQFAGARQVLGPSGAIVADVVGGVPGALVNPASAAQRVGLTALQGGAAATGFSSGETLSEVLPETATGVATGTAGGILGEYVAKLLRGAGPATKELALSQATRAMNPGKRDIMRLAESGLSEAVPEDLLKSGVLRAGMTAEQLEAAVQAELSRRGQEVGRVVGAIDAPSGGAVVQPEVVAQRVESDVVAPWRSEASEQSQAIADKAQAEADLIRKMYVGRSRKSTATTPLTPDEELYAQFPKGPMSLATAEEKLKRAHQEAALRYARNPNAPESLEAAKGVYSAARAANEDAAEASARVFAPQEAGKFVPAKQAYGRMAAAAEVLAPNASPKMRANRALSPSDYGFGIATGQAYQPGVDLTPEGMFAQLKSTVVGIPAAVVHRLVRERGNSALAVGAWNAAPWVEAAGKALAPVGRAMSSVGGRVAGGRLADDEDDEAVRHFLTDGEE